MYVCSVHLYRKIISQFCYLCISLSFCLISLLFSLSFYLSISFLFQKASLPLDVNILCFIIRLACSVCDFQTAQKSNLARHMASKHSQDLEGRLLGKQFSCVAALKLGFLKSTTIQYV